MSEHDEQVALFEWAQVYSVEIPELKSMFAIPNQGGGGKSAIARGRKMVKEGLKSGVRIYSYPLLGVIFMACFLK